MLKRKLTYSQKVMARQVLPKGNFKAKQSIAGESANGREAQGWGGRNAGLLKKIIKLLPSQ